MVSLYETCGAEMEATFNFCGKCGTKTNHGSTNSSMSTGVSPRKRTMSLEIFRSSKEKQRKSFFKCVKNKPCQQQTFLKANPYNKIVTVTVGLVKRDDKCISDKRLPVQISDKCSLAKLKETAIENHSKYDQEFCALEDYVLLYPDFKEVFYLPGSSNVFQLDK